MDSLYDTIPATFHSFEQEGPFRHCQICRQDLVQERLLYAIEKVYRGEEVILEHAICVGCMQAMQERYSEDSLAAIEQYQSQIDLETIREHYLAGNELDASLGRCAVKGHSRADLEHYHLYAFCEGDNLFLVQPPFMISGEAVEEMQELLSPETRDEMDRYTRDHLNTFPDLDKILNGPRTLLI